LNRPQALNALTHEMVTEIAAQLDEWAIDDAVATVAISGAGERGLCAGGDVTQIYRSARMGGADVARFWADEYALNLAISRYPKPYVAIMNGIVLGGGVGISAHGSVRVVTEGTKVGMPEVTIGFVPDVGSTYLLSRAPGELGTHLALTGGTATGSDAIALGLADHYVPVDAIPGFVSDLELMTAALAVARHAVTPPPSELLAQRDWIDKAYAGDHVRTIFERLKNSDIPEAREAATVIRTKSPTSVCVTLEALRRARELGTLEQVLDQEYRVGMHVLEGTEIIEGIRAQVIDKDRKPRWSPPTIEQVTRQTIVGFFAELESGRDRVG
ncbi:MAG: enoyl-CoA hydratase/isomerase family protein, partial [Rhodoglobus sp.]|nr:enoyl-CoA hydratase/isomerase family protein [Rhodoglobus sp.]